MLQLELPASLFQSFWQLDTCLPDSHLLLSCLLPPRCDAVQREKEFALPHLEPETAIFFIGALRHVRYGPGAWRTLYDTAKCPNAVMATRLLGLCRHLRRLSTPAVKRSVAGANRRG